MKALTLLSTLLALICFRTTALADSYDMPLAKKVHSLPVVAEVRIKHMEVRPDPPNKFDDLLCDCEVLQAFKLPSPTNRLTFRMNFDAPAAEYEGKKALVFASESQYGLYSPYGAKLGFILEGHAYYDRYSHENVSYAELIRKVKAIIEANPLAGANGRQPSTSQTDSVQGAAASRRSP
jgi:hypothetical protein